MVMAFNCHCQIADLEKYWRQRPDEMLGIPFQRNQEPLVIKDKVGRSQVSLGDQVQAM